MNQMRRRDFITLLGGTAAVWPLGAQAQRAPAPVIGYLNARTATEAVATGYKAAFLRGLREAGYVEGQNVTIEYRWAEGRYERLPALAAELVARPVTIIAATGSDFSTQAAKAATTAIPVVFSTAGDPVQAGWVTSLNRPSGNLTGVTSLGVELGAKLVQVLREIVPTATAVALLLNPRNASAEVVLKETEAATHALGLQLHVLRASQEGEIDAAFASLTQLRAGALVIASDAFFTTRIPQLVGLTRRHAVPAIFTERQFAVAGGLMSYGSEFADVYRQVGVYVGRILKGDKPADLPVQQATKVELVINLKTAKALGLDVPAPLLTRADEVIE
jgi:putative ABC transport system substrate-binding protein